MRGALTVIVVLLSAANAFAISGNAPPASGEFGRSIVMIKGSRESLCTGTAIARDVVLTAAHCARGSGLQVVAYNGAYPILVVRAVVHPKFSMDSYAKSRATADVALLQLAETLPQRIVPATLGSANAKAGDTFTIAGFGTVSAASDKGLGAPRMATLTATGLPGNVQLRLFDPATRGVSAGLGACTGDSGAPVFAASPDQPGTGTVGQVVGIVSWSTGPNLTAGCGGLTGVTPLNLYRAWVVDEMGKMQ